MTSASPKIVNASNIDCSLINAYLVINQGRQTGAKHANVLRAARCTMQVLENSR